MGTNYYWVPTKEIVKSKYDLLLKRISELNIEDAGETAETAMADENNNNDGTLEAVNGMIGGVIDEGAA